MDARTDLQCKESLAEQMAKEGVLVFRKIIDLCYIQEMIVEFQLIRTSVADKIKDMQRPLRDYTDIAERYPGRLDYRCGFTAPVFEEVGQLITQVIQEISPLIDFRHYWGAIPSAGGSGPTNMHRDIYSVLNTTPGMDLAPVDRDLPPYYLTVLLPLMEITAENGPTEFIKGSHRRLHVDEKQEEIFAPLLSPGDFVVFDGRTLHCGSANQTSKERVLAYMTFVANWYHDQTFTINDYLFPELSIKGR